MTLMKAKKPLALLLAFLAALSLLGTTALAAGLPEETIAAQTELCGEDCGHTHEEVFSHTEHAEESLPEPEEIAVPVATPLLEQPEPEAEQPSDTSGVIPGSGIYWELNEYGWLMLSGNGSCPTFVSPDDQPWAAVREQITQVWFEDMDALSIPSLAYWFTGCTALTMAEIPYTTPVIGAAAFADCPSLRQIQLYYSGTFTIVPGAFSTGSLTPLLVLFIPEYDSVLGTLAAYDWTEDRRAAYFEDVYGITLLATGYCSNCKRTCSYTVEYEQWTNSEHCVRHWCSNCGYDQAGGVNGEAHSFRSGVCSKCGYSNGSGGGGGLAYFLAVEITMLIAQVINFFLQRKVTFKSNSSLAKAAFWYVIAYLIISIGAAALQGLYKDPIYRFFQNVMGSAGITVADVVTMIINCAISFWVFFPIFKVIFKEEPEESK